MRWGGILVWGIVLGSVYAVWFAVGSQRWTIALWGVGGLAGAGLVGATVWYLRRPSPWRETTAEVLEVSPRVRPQDPCVLKLSVPVGGLTPVTATVRDYAVPASKWPDVGASLPVAHHVRRRHRVRVRWDRVRWDRVRMRGNGFTPEDLDGLR